MLLIETFFNIFVSKVNAFTQFFLCKSDENQKRIFFVFPAVDIPIMLWCNEFLILFFGFCIFKRLSWNLQPINDNNVQKVYVVERVKWLEIMMQTGLSHSRETHKGLLSKKENVYGAQ